MPTKTGDWPLWETTLVHREPKRLLQLVPAHRPGEGRIGDCYRTAVACLVGWDGLLEDVPHFVEERMQFDGDADWSDFRRARHWCRTLGLDFIYDQTPGAKSDETLVLRACAVLCTQEAVDA